MDRPLTYKLTADLTIKSLNQSGSIARAHSERAGVLIVNALNTPVPCEYYPIIKKLNSLRMKSKGAAFKHLLKDLEELLS